MARLPRFAPEQQLHLVVQRGNNGEKIFIDEFDRRAYLGHLSDASAACGVAVHAYALLTSEVHLLLTPATATALSRTMQSLGRRFVGAFNRRHGRTGTLWDGRFRGAVVDGAACFLDCLVYVEQAPVRAGLAAAASAWPWSSAGHHLGERRDALVVDHAAAWALGNTPFEREAAYRVLLDAGLAPARLRAIERAERTGWPLGSDAFVLGLSPSATRPLAARPRGRPRRRAVA